MQRKVIIETPKDTISLHGTDSCKIYVYSVGEHIYKLSHLFNKDGLKYYGFVVMSMGTVRAGPYYGANDPISSIRMALRSGHEVIECGDIFDLNRFINNHLSDI